MDDQLYPYGLDHGSLSFIHSYLSHRKQRTKVNSSYSDFAEIIFGVPQGSILGPLLFNIYICDLFFEDINLDVANYADDTTPYSSGSDLNTILNNLQKGVEKIFEWLLEDSSGSLCIKVLNMAWLCMQGLCRVLNMSKYGLICLNMP